MRTITAAVLGMILPGAGAIAAAQGTATGAEPRTPGEEKAINLCSTCHGPRGISTSPEFPILAAQRAGYLESQLEAFRAKTREEKIAHDFMWGIAYNLDDAMIRSVALYYSTQAPAPGHATFSSSTSSASGILPAECLPTPSNTSTTVTSWPWNLPGMMEPP